MMKGNRNSRIRFAYTYYTDIAPRAHTHMYTPILSRFFASHSRFRNESANLIERILAKKIRADNFRFGKSIVTE